MAEGKLKIHSENLLPIIKKWLYSDRDIFLRELVSNSCDALSKLVLLRDSQGIEVDEKAFRVEVKLDKEAKTITISDNGIGMSKEEVEEYICQLAFSGAEDFMKKYETSETKDSFIGHFGLGFYSAFMVSENVHIETKSYKEDSPAAHWDSDGSTSYNIDKSSKGDRGTDIVLHINDDEFLEEAHVSSTLKKYCSFLPYPVYFNEERINPDEPLWIKSPSDCTDEEYLNFYRKLYPAEPDPIFWIHLNIDHPFNLQGILYFPKITPRFDFAKSHMKLFSNRVFVSDNVEGLFPDFLGVLRGTIDSSDIPLNVSRSYLQMDSTVRKLATHIAKKVADKLGAFYKNEQEKFEGAWPNMETIIKLGMLHDDKFYERAKPFLIWKNTEDKWQTIETYSETHQEGYEGKVFYTTSDSSHSTFLDLYKEKGIEVLIGGGALDTAIFNNIETKSEGKVKFQRIDGGIDDVIIDGDKSKDVLEADGKSEAAHIAENIKADLDIEGIEVEAKSLATESLPGFVMIDEASRRMREYMSMTQKEMPQGIFGKHTFVVNTNNKLVEKLATIREMDVNLAKLITTQIYHTSLLAQKELHPDTLSEYIQQTNQAIEKLAMGYGVDIPVSKKECPDGVCSIDSSNAEETCSVDTSAAAEEACTIENTVASEDACTIEAEKE